MSPRRKLIRPYEIWLFATYKGSQHQDIATAVARSFLCGTFSTGHTSARKLYHSGQNEAYLYLTDIQCAFVGLTDKLKAHEAIQQIHHFRYNTFNTLKAHEAMQHIHHKDHFRYSTFDTLKAHEAMQHIHHKDHLRYSTFDTLKAHEAMQQIHHKDHSRYSTFDTLKAKKLCNRYTTKTVLGTAHSLQHVPPYKISKHWTRLKQHRRNKRLQTSHLSSASAKNARTGPTQKYMSLRCISWYAQRFPC